MIIHEASLSGVLRVLFWIFVVSMIIRLIARLAAPYVIRRTEDMLRQRMQDFQRQQQPPQRQEGDVSIESKNRNSNSSREGEYVDFVEIKD